MALVIKPKAKPHDRAARPRAVPPKKPTPKSISSAMEGNRFTYLPNTVATYVKHTGVK